MFRAQRMVWVDLLIDRDAAHEAVHLLARARIIELRGYDRDEPPFEVASDAGVLARLRTLDQDLAAYRRHLPPPPAQTPGALTPAAPAVAQLEASIGQWIAALAPLSRELRAAESLIEEYALLERCLQALPSTDYDLGYFARLSRSHLYAAFVALGHAGDAGLFRDGTRQVLCNAYALPDDTQAQVFIGVAATRDLPELERAGHQRGMRFLGVPGELDGLPRHAGAQLRAMRTALSDKARGLREQIASVGEQAGIAAAARDLARYLWAAEVVGTGVVGARFVWLGGWVANARYRELLDTLRAGAVPFLANRDAAGEHGVPPVLLDNPGWLRRFEVFASAFGVPAHDDVDPTPVLALTTPLMFGYMFGDVGQGAVLLVLGALLRHRLPLAALLVPAGASSILFGFVFGSVFGNEHLLAPLWVTPLSAPLVVLGVPLLVGFALIGTGMLLAAVQAHWQASAGRWWRREFPIAVCYGALPLAVANWRAGAALAALAIAGALLERAVSGHRAAGVLGALSGVARGVAQLLETLAQLAINTLSFVRLGAFALAHAGLGTAVMSLAGASGNVVTAAVIVIVGNAVIVALEGLVVSIQTTRLVMFEFFRRFYTGRGSRFDPLAPPANNASPPRQHQEPS